MAQEIIISSFVERWSKNPAIKSLCDQYLGDIKLYGGLYGSSEREKRIELRKTWSSMSDKYWKMVELTILSMARELSEDFFFNEKQKLLVDCGFLSPVVTNLTPELACWGRQEKPVDIFNYYGFTDLLVDNYRMLFNKKDEGLESHLKEVYDIYVDRLKELRKKVCFSMKVLLPQIETFSKDKANELVDKLDLNLDSYLERHMRTRRFREMEKSDYDLTIEKSNIFSFAQKEIYRLLKEATRTMESFGENERAKITSMVEDVIFAGTLSFHARNEIDRMDRAVKRSAQKYRLESDGDRQVQMQESLVNKRNMAGQMARVARLDTSQLCQHSVKDPLTFSKASEILNRLLKLDEEMLRVPRVRMYGIPRVVIIPGNGYGVYDWTDNTIMLPLFPSKSAEQAVAYGLASFRWDADEDRDLKNTYELLKENKGKSIKDLALSFYNDYYLWLVKERAGYRILHKEVRKWFFTKFKSDGVKQI